MGKRMRAFAAAAVITLAMTASPAAATDDNVPPEPAGVSGADIDKWFNADVVAPKG